MIDLIAEINSAGDSGAALRLLRDADVADRVSLTPAGIGGAFGFAQIEPLPDGTFAFAEGARAAIIIAIHENDEIIDLVAWRPGRPDRWRRRLGAATFAGQNAVRAAAFFHRPLRIFSSPLSWLRAGCEGAVILDPEADILPALEGVSEIQAETIELGRMIERQLAERNTFRLPKIFVPEPAARAA